MTIYYPKAAKLLGTKIAEMPNVIKHSVAVGELCYHISKTILKRHPELNIRPEFVRIAGLLHDIGRGDHSVMHQVSGGRILRELDLAECARMTEVHGHGVELSQMKNVKGDFLPRTIEEEILVFADFHTKHDQLVSLQERMSDLKVRYRDNKDVCLALRFGKKRIQKIERKINRLLGSDRKRILRGQTSADARTHLIKAL